MKNNSEKNPNQNKISNTCYTENDLYQIFQKNFFENNLDILCVFDFSGKILMHNHSFERILDFSPEEIENTPIQNFIYKEDLDSFQKKFDLLKQGQNVLEFQSRWALKNGSYKWILFRGFSYHEKQIVFSICQDITEKKTLKDDLVKNKIFLEKVLNSLTIPIFLKDLEGNYILCNKKMSEFLGISQKELIGTFIMSKKNKKSESELKRQDKEVLEYKKAFIYEMDSFDAEGNQVVMQIYKAPFYNNKNEITGIIGAMSDITQMKKLEEEIIQSKSKIQAMLDNIPFYAWMKNIEGIFMAVNKPFAAFFGVKPEDMIGLGEYDFWDKKTADLYMEEDKRVIESQTPLHIKESMNTQGKNITPQHTWVEVFKSPILDKENKTIGTVGLSHDITTEYLTQIQLRESEEKFRVLASSVPFGFLIYQDNKWIYMNPAIEKITGYSSTMLLNNNIEKLLGLSVSEKNKILFLKNAEDRKRNSEHLTDTLIEFKTRENKIKWLRFLGNTITVNNKPAGLVTIIDMTSEKEAENLLKLEKEKLSITLRSIQDCVLTIDISGKIILMNRSAEEIIGISFKNAENKYYTEILNISNSNTGEHFQDILSEITATGEPLELNSQAILRTNSGETKHIAINASPIHDNFKKIIGIVIILRDISETRLLELERQKNDKLESLGFLAGGIAHDFNNILMAILGNVSLALLIEKNSEINELLYEVEKASLRAKNLTIQLLTFAKGGNPVRKNASIVEIIRDSAEFVLRGSKSHIEYRFQKNLPTISVDSGQISQVIQNLIINANQAMELGGTIYINVYLEPISQHLTISSGKYMVIQIKDEGHGIPEDIVNKIFDPYFTTKSTGNGLGLAVVHSIIRNHGGYIFVNSQINSGTTFRIYLPLYSQDNSKIDEEHIEINNLNNIKIIMIDDEESIIELTQKFTAKLNINFQGFSSSQKGLEVFTNEFQSGKPFDLVILDLTIPGQQGGDELLKQIKKIDPKIKSLVSSGYSTNPILSNPREYGFDDALLKPYSFNDFHKMMNKIFNSNR